MSQSPSSAITTFSPILTRRRARDKLDSAATCDGHCKNKSTLTDTSANFTDHPHPLSSPSVQPTSLATFQATQRFPETTSPHFTFEFPSLSHKLSASDHESSPDPSQPFLITWNSNRIENYNECSGSEEIKREIAKKIKKYNLSWSLETQIVSRNNGAIQLHGAINSNGAIQIQWCYRTDHNM